MKIFFATSAAKQKSRVLNAVGAKRRLVSYWYIKTVTPTFIEEYVEDGIHHTNARRSGRRKKRKRPVLEE